MQLKVRSMWLDIFCLELLKMGNHSEKHINIATLAELFGNLNVQGSNGIVWKGKNGLGIHDHADINLNWLL